MGRHFATALMLVALACPALAAEGEPGVTPADSLAGGAPADSLAGDDLAATTAAPWNPEKALPPRAGWDTALDLPGRLVTYPISGLGWLTRETMLQLEARAVFQRTTTAFVLLPQLGVYLATAGLGDRVGFGGTLRLQPPGWGRFVLAEWTGTTLQYSRTRLGLSAGPITAYYAYDWRPQDYFSGVGLQSSLYEASTYASQTQDVRIALNLGPALEAQPRPYPLRVLLWTGQHTSVMRNGRDDSQPTAPPFGPGDAPSIQLRYPQYSTQLDDRREQWVTGVRITSNQRFGHPHWTQGFRVAAEAVHFDKPIEQTAIYESQAEGPHMNRYTLDAETGFSFHRDPRTIRIAFKAVDNELLANSAPLEVIDLARLGGGDGLRGFDPYRFYDNDALVGKISYIFPLAEHFELDTHVESGGVYPDLYQDPRITTLKMSYGVSLRPRTMFGVLGEVGVDWSFERTRFHFAIGGIN